MPTRTDYSDYFTITGLPETKAFSHSDSITLSDSFSKSVSTWREVVALTDLYTSPTDSFSKSVADWKFVRSVSDSFGLSDALSRSVETWRYIESHSDSISTSDSFSKSVYTFRSNYTHSDTLSNSDSITKSVDTWRHILAFEMTLSVSESLSRATDTWKHVFSLSDSVSSTDALDVDVETIIHIFSPNDNVTTSDSLSKTVQAWFNTFTPTDSFSITDGLTVATPIDSDQYFWDSGNLKDKSILTGYIDSGNFTSDVSRVSNASNLLDGNTSSICTFSGSNSEACIVFDMTAQIQFNFLALYGVGGSIKLYASNSQGSSYEYLWETSIGNNRWSVSIFGNKTYRYWALQMEGLSSDVKLHEILLGKSFVPEVRYGMGSSEGLTANLIREESYTGTEYISKRGDVELSFSRQYDNISSTLKNDFENIWLRHNDRKFLYYYNGHNYVQMDPVKTSEIAHNRYSTSISLST